MPGRLLTLLLALAPLGALAQQEDLSEVEVRSTPLAPHLYLLQGAGGNITASVGADGALLVDDSFAPLAAKIQAAVDSAAGAPRPVRFVINTHFHFDHSGGNGPLARAGALIIGHDALRARLATDNVSGTGGAMQIENKAQPRQALPGVTFDHELTVHLNDEDIQAVHYAAAHTDGDSIIYFTQAHAVAMGDIFVRYGFPFIDVRAGGSVQGMIEACEDVLRRVPAGVKIIPGHGEVAQLSDLAEYVQMLKDTSARVAGAIKAGKSPEQMKRERILARWSGRYAPPKAFVDTDAFIDQLYYSLNRRVARHGSLKLPHH